MNDAKKLAEEHWKYVEELLRTHGQSEEMIKIVKFHYVSAMVHGVGHGYEMCNVENKRKENEKLRKEKEKL